MNFARKQLEKYGWKDGDGLGKDCQGMVAALKPHLKSGKEGMGFDICQELTGTWWTKAYSDSLDRISVSVSANAANDEEIAVSIKQDEEDLPNAKILKEDRPMEKMRRRMMKANFTSFAKGGTLSNGELVEEESEQPTSCSISTPKIKILSDAELLKACGGRTAHKAARFGLKLNGKLARIAAQEGYGFPHNDCSSSINTDESESNTTVEEKPVPDEYSETEKKGRKKHKEKNRDNREGGSCKEETPTDTDACNTNGTELSNVTIIKIKKNKKRKVDKIQDELGIENYIECSDSLETQKMVKKSKGSPSLEIENVDLDETDSLQIEIESHQDEIKRKKKKSKKHKRSATDIEYVES